MLRWVMIGYGLLSLIGAAILLFLVHATFWLVQPRGNKAGGYRRA
jgi:hypothetical protein